MTPDGTPLALKAMAELKPPEIFVVTTAYPLWPRCRYPDVGETEMLKAPFDAVVTVSDTLAVCVMPPPVPVTVIVYVPVVVVEATAMVIVDVPEPGAAMDVGLKLTVTPVGWPLAVRPIAELKPPETAVVIVDVPLLPCTTETEVGEAEMVKFGVGVLVTVSETLVVSVVLPEVPVTVIG